MEDTETLVRSLRQCVANSEGDDNYYPYPRWHLAESADVIDALAARVKELEEMQTGATEAVDHYIQELHDMALLADQDSDTDERIIGACHARHHMFRGQEQAKTKEQSGEGL